MDKLTANELRIGNFVYVFDNILSQVDWIQKESVSVLYDRQDNLSNGAIVSYGNAKPIPLTEEWLLSMGFKKFCNDFSKKGIIIHTRKRGFIIKKSVPQMRYVHQLQNYFFALSGEELTIKSN